jgi:hypothetical protein
MQQDSPPGLSAATNMALDPNDFLTQVIGDNNGNVVDLSNTSFPTEVEEFVNEWHSLSFHGSENLSRHGESLAIPGITRVAKSVPSRPQRPQDWEAKRTTITQLYWNENKDLPEVMSIMEEQHGFSAT